MQPTKFNILWDAYCHAKEEHQKYRNVCSNFLSEFLNKLIGYLNCSVDLVEIGTSQERFLHYREAIYKTNQLLVPSSKGYWQFWLKLTLANQAAQPSFPCDPRSVDLIVPFTFKYDGQNFHVTATTTQSKTFEIRSPSSEDFVALADFMFEAIYRKVQDEIQWELEVDPELKQLVV